MQVRTHATSVKLLIAATVLVAAATITAQAPVTFDTTLARGITAFKAGRFADAAQAFRQALDLDPKSTTALIDLACAYAYQVVPNLNTPENLALADKAIALFRQIPAEDPNRRTALKQIATLLRNTARLDEARDTEVAALDLQPNDADTHYTIGVIDWMQAYRIATEALAAAGLTDNGMGNERMTPATCEKIRTHNAPLIDDAILHLIRAIDLRPTYSDAMQYLNLVYRRKADFACTDPSARAQDLAAADDWIRKAAQAHKAAAQTLTPPIQ